MSDARWGDPREYDARDRGDDWSRVYDVRDRDPDDPRDALMHNLDLPLSNERELVVDRDRVYELDGEDSRALSALRDDGLTLRQREFLVTVMVHSGCFLERQY